MPFHSMSEDMTKNSLKNKVKGMCCKMKNVKWQFFYQDDLFISGEEGCHT